MAGLSRRNSHREASAWPGWVDALSSLVMVVIFLLMIFVVGQFLLASTLTGRDEQLSVLNRKVAELNDLLSLERESNGDLRISIAQISAELQSSVVSRDDMASRVGSLVEDLAAARRAAQELQESVRVDRETIELKLREILSLQADLTALREARNKLEGQMAEAAMAQRLSEDEQQALLAELGKARDRSTALSAEIEIASEKTMLAQKQLDARDIRIAELVAALAGETTLTAQSKAEVETLGLQIEALRRELAQLAAVLEASEERTSQQNVQIAELGARLNQALAEKVQDLSRYRSEFFGRVREALGNRPDVRIVGDRFVFQSELLFPSGSATLQDEGKDRLIELARSLIQIGQQIPTDINWVLRVDGHTDIRPVRFQFNSNWELSAARAISVVKFLSEQGIPPERLAAAGFAEFQPLDPGTTEEALARNRRIELKLDQR